MKTSLRIFITLLVVTVIGIILYAVFSKNKEEFPATPKEGDTVKVNGVEYTYIAGRWVKKDVVTGGIVSNANENRLKYEVAEDTVIERKNLSCIGGYVAYNGIVSNKECS